MPGCPVPFTLADFTWLYTAAAWLFLAAGLALLLWSLFWDRARGRRRCPKCWYDMAGVPGLRCPECGRAWKSERKLRKTRRRWRWIAPAMILFIAAYGVHFLRVAVKHGWPRAVPTTPLILASPWVAEKPPFVPLNRPFKPRWQHLLYGELLGRVNADQLSKLQGRLLAEVGLRCVHRQLVRTSRIPTAAGELLRAAQERGHLSSPQLRERAERLVGVEVRLRDRWPVGVPMWGRVWLGRWARDGDTRVTLRPRDPGAPLITHSERQLELRLIHRLPQWSPWNDGLEAFPAAMQEFPWLRYEVEFEGGDVTKGSWAFLTSRALDVPTRIVASVDGIMLPVECPGLAERLVTDSTTPIVHVESGRLYFQWWPDEAALKEAGNPTFAVSIELLAGDHLIAVGHAWWRARSGGWGDGLEPREFSSVPLGFFSPAGLADISGVPLRVRMTPDPITALRDFESDRYWSGELTMPVTVGAPRTFTDYLNDIANRWRGAAP